MLLTQSKLCCDSYRMMMAYRFLLLLEDCDELGPLHSTARDTAFNKTSALTTAETTAETSCSGPSETT